MFTVSIDTDTSRFREQLKAWGRKIGPRERRCIQDKMADGAREAAIDEAYRVTRGVTGQELGKIITVTRQRTQIRTATGRFTGAFNSVGVRGLRRNRTSQVLILMATGGEVTIPSREMETMTINYKYTVPRTFRLFREVLRTGKEVSSTPGVVTWYTPRSGSINYSLTKVHGQGYFLHERSGRYYKAVRKSGSTGGNRRSELIGFWPEFADYQPNQYRFTEVTVTDVERNFRRYVEECFANNTGAAFRRGSRIRGTGTGS